MRVSLGIIRVTHHISRITICNLQFELQSAIFCRGQPHNGYSHESSRRLLTHGNSSGIEPAGGWVVQDVVDHYRFLTFCRLFFARWAKNNLQKSKVPEWPPQATIAFMKSSANE